MTLRVLQISQNYFIRGGSDIMFFRNIELLKLHGHQVIPFAAQSPKNEPGEWNHHFPLAADFEHPKPLDLIRFVYSMPARRSLEKIIQEYRPQIAHLHIYYGKITTSILPILKDAGIPIVQTLHEYKLICPVYSLVSINKICEACEGRHFYRALPRKCNSGSLKRTVLSVIESYVSRALGSVDSVDRFIAVSKALEQKVVKHGVPPEKVITLHNWLDVTDIQPASHIGHYFLYFGRIERLKGIFTLLEAASHVPDIPLLLVGEGNAHTDVMELIQKTELAHVKLLGFKKGDELQELIRNSICTLLPSEWFEPFGLTVLETFAHGRPVIGSAIGGIPELIDDGQNGFLFEPGNALALQTHMAWMAENPDRALEMGSAGRQKVETKFSQERYYTRLMEIYQDIL